MGQGSFSENSPIASRFLNLQKQSLASKPHRLQLLPEHSLADQIPEIDADISEQLTVRMDLNLVHLIPFQVKVRALFLN